MRVAHICIIHRPLDTRVFCKECRTLAAAGHDVHLLAPEPPSACMDGVRFHPLTRARPNAWSVLKSAAGACRKAASLGADVYHIHEPALIPAGVVLKLAGSKVVYDVHEDAPQQARLVGMNKGRPLWGWFASLVWSSFEVLAKWFLDAFVCATPAIARKFAPAKTVVVYNYPMVEDFPQAQRRGGPAPYADRANHVLYAGGISATRGIREMVEAVDLLPESLRARLILLGRFAPPELEEQVRQLPGWRKVDFRGWQSREDLLRAFTQARVGLVLFHPAPNHREALPNKLFETMAAGIPVVASDFPLWRRLVESSGCGLVVDPLDASAVARAIQYLLEHPKEAEAMGRRGQEAVSTRYNWAGEAEKLLALYRSLRRS